MAAGAWTGFVWLADKRRWERVCFAGSIAECSQRLGKVARRRGVAGWQTCLTRDRPPTSRPIQPGTPNPRARRRRGC
jgi:hypothetical protein